MPASAEPTPMRLLQAIARLRARARTETGTQNTGLSLSQITILARVVKEGPQTASELAQAEHVSQQAIAQSLTVLKTQKLVRVKPDPNDRRKGLIEATPAGHRVRDSVANARAGWLARAIASVVGRDERATLAAAIDLLERLADADVTGSR
jgi:DNA-binding MarR family transcriptional regulator